MTNLNDLIKKARGMSSPLGYGEAEKLIKGAKVVAGKSVKGKGMSTFGRLSFFLIAGVSASASVYFFAAGERPQAEPIKISDSFVTKDSEEERAGIAVPQNESNSAENRTDKTHARIEVRREDEEHIVEKVPDRVDQSTGNVEEVKDKAEKGSGNPENFVKSVEDAESKDVSDAVNTDSLKTVLSDSVPPLDPRRKFNDTGEEKPKRERKNFVRTDLFGHVSGKITEAYIKKMDDVDISEYTAGRRSIGYERKIMKRLGVDVTASSGFMDEMIFSEIYSKAAKSEVYINYKGWSVDLGLKYYPLINSKGSGFFLGPYASVGKLSERMFVFEIDTLGKASWSTLGVTSGTSIGAGIFAGGRLVSGNFFAEVSCHGTLRGRDFGYSEIIMTRQRSLRTERYSNFTRIFEVSVGYKF